jgi:hypothetical protein
MDLILLLLDSTNLFTGNKVFITFLLWKQVGYFMNP